MAEPVLVDGAWVQSRIASGSIVVVDVRPPPFYGQGHLPTAVNLPLLLLSSPAGQVDAGKIVRYLGHSGISRQSHAVLYDDGASAQAAQLFWLLQAIGHERVSVLDGGVTAWAKDGRDVDTVPHALDPVDYGEAHQDPEPLATIDDVRAALDDPNAIIVDSRSPAEYLGLQFSAARDGHIPTAINIDAAENLAMGEDGVVRFQSAEALRNLYETAGVTPDKSVIVHCQTGARSSQSYMALKALGYPRVRNYVAGWQEWGNRTDTDVEPE